MTPLIVPGSAHPRLAEDIAREIQSELASCLLERFPDGEQRVEIQASGDGLTLAASVNVTAEVATGPVPHRPRARLEPAPSP